MMIKKVSMLDVTTKRLSIFYFIGRYYYTLGNVFDHQFDKTENIKINIQTIQI